MMKDGTAEQDSSILVSLYRVLMSYEEKFTYAVRENQVELLKAIDFDNRYPEKDLRYDRGFNEVMNQIKTRIVHNLIRDNIGGEIYGTAFTQEILDHYQKTGRWPQLRITMESYE